jgi:hypothetical protein
VEATHKVLALVDLLDPERYACAPPGHSPIGAHLRHCLEHFQAFVAGWRSGVVDYDARRRDPEVERDPAACRREFLRVVDALAGLTPSDMANSISVVQMPAENTPGGPMASTVERELVFLSSHCIHHLALVIHMAEAAGVSVPRGLGLAYSTAAATSPGS